MKAVTVAIVATDNFSPFHFSVPCILFGDKVSDSRLFSVKICAETLGTIKSKEGFSIEVTDGLEAMCQADIVIIPFWENPYKRPSQNLLDALVQAWKNGAQVVGLCIGAFVLAYAGLLNNKRASTHWEYEEDFQKIFPNIHLDINALYIEDERLITSAGTAAALDCCLYVIRQRFGSIIANQIARRMIIPPYREGGQAQFIDHHPPKNIRDTRMNELVDYLRRNLNQVLDIDTLALSCSMSRRTLTRHFIKATGMTVTDWISTERLRRSQTYLESGHMSIEQVAEHVGFQSVVTYRQQFKTLFGVSPSKWRKTFQNI